MEYSKKDLEEIFNNTFAGLTMFVRDINLSLNLEKKYTKGLILREKAYVDVSSKIGGISTTHRFCILSNHIHDLSSLEKGTNYGYCVAERDSHFKVLDKINLNDKIIIILLHLPYDETWKAFMNTKTNIEDEITNKIISTARTKFNEEPIKELMTEEWIKKCSFPIGMKDDGELFELE